MKKTEFWMWLMADDWGRRRKSPCRFTEEQALKRDPTATRIEGTCVVIDVAETPAEIFARAPTTRHIPRDDRLKGDE